jgi:hypothetical protein
MIYDSIRQAKPAIRSNFGAGRLNNRISFYLFEINRLFFIQSKSSHFNKFSKSKNSNEIPLEKLIYITTLDSTLFSYRFFYI